MTDHIITEFSIQVGRNVLSAQPKISVVIPVYNAAEFISETLISVAAQKFREYEVIVVNDGSPDTLAFERAIRTQIEDIIYIRQPNNGAAEARNVAIRHSRGEIIAFLDGDDIWLPDYLSSQYLFLTKHNYDMVYSDAFLMGLNSPYRRTFMETAPSNGVADFNAILDLRCNVITSGTLARKQAIIDAGMFNARRPRAHDFMLWLRMAKNGAKIGYQRKQLLKYRVHLNSLSGDSISRVEREIDAFQHVSDVMELDDEQQKIVTNRLACLEADLAVEQGKAFLLAGDYREAAVAFRVANRYRKSLKLSVITWLAQHAPRTLLRHYKKHRASEIALVPKLSR